MDRQTDEWKDEQTLFYGTFQGTTGSPNKQITVIMY